MPTVKRHAFSREKMERDRVASEGIHDQKVITRRRAVFQRTPGISKDDIDPARGILQIGEIPAGNKINVGVEFVKIYPLARVRIRRQRPCPQPDQTNALEGKNI